MRILLTAEEIRKAIRDQILGQTIIGSGSEFDTTFRDDTDGSPVDITATVDIVVVDERPKVEIIRRSPFTKIGETTIAPLAKTDEAPVVISRRGRPPGAKNKPKTPQEEAQNEVAQSDTDAAEAPEANAVARVSPFSGLTPLKPAVTEIEAAPDVAEEPVAEAGEEHTDEPELPLEVSATSDEIPAIFATDPNAVEPEPVSEELAEEEVPVVVSKRSLFGAAAAKAEEAVEEPAAATNGEEEEAPKSASRSIFANLKSIQHSRS